MKPRRVWVCEACGDVIHVPPYRCHGEPLVPHDIMPAGGASVVRWAVRYDAVRLGPSSATEEALHRAIERMLRRGKRGRR